MFQRSKDSNNKFYSEYPRNSPYQMPKNSLASTSKKRKLEITQKIPYNSHPYQHRYSKTVQRIQTEQLNNQSYIYPSVIKEQPQRIVRPPHHLQKKISELTNCKSATNLTRIKTYPADNNITQINRDRSSSFLTQSNVIVPRNCFTSLPRQQFLGTTSRAYIQVNDSLKTGRPEDMHRFILEQQGIQVKPDAQFKKMSPTFLYEYAARNEQTKNNQIGYVQDGVHRNFSNLNDMSQSYLPSNRNFLGHFINTDRKFAFETSNKLYQSSNFKGEPITDRKISFRSAQQKGIDESEHKLSPAPFMEIQNSIPLKRIEKNPQSQNLLDQIFPIRPFKTQQYS